MKMLLETMTDSQHHTLRAAADWTEACLAMTERQTLLTLEVTRTTLEQSSELVLLCWQACLPESSAARTLAPLWALPWVVDASVLESTSD